MSTIVLIVLVFLFGVFVVPVLQGLLTDEARGWLPHLARAMVRAAARRLPPAHRERYQQEWLAELAAYSDRRLTAVIRACSLWVGARAMRAELDDAAATRSASRGVPRLDQVMAGVLVLFLSPVLAAIAVAIRLDTRGPVLIRELSRDRLCLKFRTMVTGDSSSLLVSPPEDAIIVDLFDTRDRWLSYRELQAWKGSPDERCTRSGWANDLLCVSMLASRHKTPQVTRVGRLLRRSRLDALPMLFSVLSGDVRMPYPRVASRVRRRRPDR